MEGLEERGLGRLQTWEEEREMYWSGGGEALRCKRQREWEERGWEELELIEEEDKGTMPGEDVMVREDNAVNDENVKDVRENGGRMVDRDGGGDVGAERGRQVGEEPKRKPLRGKRRGRKSIRGEEAERMAATMARWLGTKPHRVKD